MKPFDIGYGMDSYGMDSYGIEYYGIDHTNISIPNKYKINSLEVRVSFYNGFCKRQEEDGHLIRTSEFDFKLKKMRTQMDEDIKFLFRSIGLLVYEDEDYLIVEHNLSLCFEIQKLSRGDRKSVV